MRSSFQTRRFTCQVPSATNTTKKQAAKATKIALNNGDAKFLFDHVAIGDKVTILE